jgi:hypothetical protein
MPRFIVHFIEDVPGESGHVSQVCQATVELDAHNHLDAEQKAKRNSARSTRHMTGLSVRIV